MKLQDLPIDTWQVLPLGSPAKLLELLWQVRGKPHLRFQLEHNDDAEMPL
jgi:hypothetical protein